MSACPVVDFWETKMTDETVVEYTFGLADPTLEDDERRKFATKLLRELRNSDEVNQADRVEDLNPEAGGKGFATLVGILSAEVSVANIKAFMGFLGDRLADKPIEGKIKVGNNEVEFKVKSRQELVELEKATLKLIEALGGGTSA